MQHDQNLPARRSLLASPQVLGVLPTLWFWNDRERQGLLMPLIVATGVPLAAVLAYATAKLHLNGWIPPVFAVLYPFLMMGAVERRIRRELRLRPLEQRLASPSAPPRSMSPLATVALAASCAGAGLLLTFGATLPVVVFSLLAGATAASALLSRTRRSLSQIALLESKPEAR